MDARVRACGLLLGATLVGACAGDAPQATSEAPAGAAAAAAPGLPDSVDLVEGPQPLRGMMTYMADAARFTECGSGASFAIAMEGAYLELERAYLGARSEPAEPLLVTFTGRLVERAGMEGGPVPTVLVDAFEAAHPGLGCGDEEVDRPLEGTEWVLAEVVGGVEVPGGVEATLVLEPAEGRTHGSSGCNRFTGTYTLAGGRLTFGMGALTRMACAEPLMGLETDYLEALRRVGSWRISGATLELLGEEGPVARLVAR